jgi:hypothetical protein
MNTGRMIAVGALALLLSGFLIPQIVYQLRSGTFRALGSNVDRTREDHPIWYWSAIGSQAACVLLMLYVLAAFLLRAPK